MSCINSSKSRIFFFFLGITNINRYWLEFLHLVVITGNGTFHEQHSIGYGFPSLLLATRASADVSELVFKHEWRSQECLKTIPTHPLRHTWPEVVMGNHTRSSAVHGKSFHKGLTKRSIIFM